PRHRAGRRENRWRKGLGPSAQAREGQDLRDPGRQAQGGESHALVSAPLYEVYAVKYAHHARRASENFIGGDPHDRPMPLEYLVWLVRGEGREFVADTGFSAAMAAKRRREHIRCPSEGLKLLGCDAKAVKDVIVTHLHYDHIGNFELFPAATFHLQDREMNYATGRHMCQGVFRGAYEVAGVVGM